VYVGFMVSTVVVVRFLSMFCWLYSTKAAYLFIYHQRHISLVTVRDCVVWGVGLRFFACWWIESQRGHGCLSLEGVVSCCQVAIFASGWSPPPEKFYRLWGVELSVIVIEIG
jgi:hypothetical protein